MAAQADRRGIAGKLSVQCQRRDNIAIHYPSADMTQVVRVAQLAGAHDFILDMPEGYDTIV